MSATRRQKQLERKYNSIRRMTGADEYSYLSNLSRSSSAAYRSSRSPIDGGSRQSAAASSGVTDLSNSSTAITALTTNSTSTTVASNGSVASSVFDESDMRSFPVYVTIQDYSPGKGDTEGISLDQGQIVEVLDSQNPSLWLVRTKARPPQTGYVPGSYFETPSHYYKQRKQTRELTDPAGGSSITNATLSEEQEAVLKREQVYHDLLKTEEDFVAELRACVDHYSSAIDNEPNDGSSEIRANVDKLLTLNLGEIHNFHANVMLKGLQYYSDAPGNVGGTFIRLERDFEMHVNFVRELPQLRRFLSESNEVRAFLTEISAKYFLRSYDTYASLVETRIKQYENFFKEIIKYSARLHANESDAKITQKALELIQSISKRASEIEYTKNIVNYPGDTSRLGRIYRHDLFQVWDGDEELQERYVFLFRNKLMLTERDTTQTPPVFKHLSTIRIEKYTVRPHTADEDSLVFRPNEQGLPSFRIRANDYASQEFVRKAWLKDITDMQELRPDEGPPRKKVKSPPVISPTGSSTSLYSNGSSSVEWATTGTTLEMQGTRVTRTQYGFRTLQESSAKMCLKVTGYPLPDITWYKDDVLLKQDERHTFYSDDDGFFALTIDPVQTGDTGKYTCVATNEYGQASTSAFFRVLKVEKESAEPTFKKILNHQECKEGDIVNFDCEVDGWPEPELVWLVDDQPLRPSHDFKIQYDGQLAKLEIRDAQPDDTGTYTVKITNEYGTAITNAKLIVQPDPDKNHVAPEFQAVIEDVECYEGDTVRFKAVLTGDPNPDVIWYVNGVPLTESEKIRFISEDGICIVTIKDVSRHFDGIVTCQGKNRLGTSECKARLRVLVPPLAPQFDRPLEDRVVTEHSAVMFEVDVSGYPEPDVEFFLKGRPLRDGVDGVTIERQDGNYKVTVRDCLIDAHDGEIVARATNEHGQAESRARLTVEPEEEESRSAPTFVKDIEDQTVKFGEAAVFDTVVRGSPNPVVHWFLNGQKLEVGQNGCKIETNGGDHKLTLDSTVFSGGTVLCRAENAIGRFDTKARLIVLPIEKKKRAPEFRQPLQDKTETEGNVAVFEVTVEAEPAAQLRWTIDGRELQESDRVHIREFDGSSKLEIHDVRLAEAGQIRCTATNSEGEATTQAKFTVLRRSKAPSFDQRPQSVTVERGSEAVFEAHADAVPAPEYQWSINGRKVYPSTDGARIETNAETGMTRLFVDTSKLPDSGPIVVRAENQLGADEASARIIVIEPIRLVEAEKLQEENVDQFQTEQPLQSSAQEGKADEGAKPNEITVQQFDDNKLLELTKPLADQTVERGQAVKFETQIRNATQVQWSVDGRPVSPTNPPDGFHFHNEVFDFTLTIDNARNAGTVKCFARGELNSVDTAAVYAVTNRPVPEFAQALEEHVEVHAGERVQAEVLAPKSERIMWYRNGERIRETDRGITIHDDGNGRSALTIDSAEPEHNGHWSVVAENESGRVESSSNVKVLPPILPARIMEPPRSVTVVEHERVEFRSTIVGEPKPTVRWTINEKIVEQSTDQVHVSESADGVQTLTIPSASVQQSGPVTITVENSQGRDQSTATLNVQSVESLRQPPVFTKTPQDHVTQEETSVKFSAIVTGFPQPQITWLLNNNVIATDEMIRVKYDHSTGKTSIRIFKPEVGNSGVVDVRAVNEHGQAAASANLTVEKKMELPHFLATIDDRQVSEGGNVRFTARIGGQPRPDVQWTLNGQPVTAQNSKISDTPDGTYTLELTNVGLDQTGEIGCQATNTLGHKKEIAQLIVKETGEAPIFTKYLEDRLVQEKEIVIMETRLGAVRPPPTVQWLRDGQPIESGGHFRLTEESIAAGGSIHKLTITSAELSDKGRITIRAENKFGSAESSATIAVQQRRSMAKPAFQSEIGNVTVTEGDSLNVRLIITGDPEPQAKWFIRPNGQSDFQQVFSTPDTELKQSKGVYSMTIHGCSTDMTGTIKCVASNRMGDASTEGKLTIVAPIPVEFESQLCDATCREGDTLKLKAVLLGEPMPEVTWYINGKRLVETQNIKIHAEKGTYTVTIKDITCDYSGKVVCEAINEFGRASSEATLKVLPRGEPPDFLEWLSNVRARQSSTVTHRVVFTGDPKPTLTWFINNKKVKNSEEISINTDESTSTLTIHSFNSDRHVGEIICKAENDAGEVSCTANMATYSSDLLSESDSLNEEARLREEFEDELRQETHRTPTPVMAPAFITKIKDTRASRGHQAIFECVVPDTKGVCCKWLKDGREIELIARIRVQMRTIEGFTTSELVIDDVEPEDAGKYTVIVENTAGKDRCEANLTVVEAFEKPTERQPEFVIRLRDKEVNAADRVMFECKVSGVPAPAVQWLHAGQPIQEEPQRVRIETEDGGIHRLVLESVRIDEQGAYACVAQNALGKSETSAELKVLTQAPKFTRPLADQRAAIGEQVILECSVFGVPPPAVEFFSVADNFRLQTGTRHSIQHDATNTHWRLVIDNLIENDYREYRAEARNVVGVVECDARVDRPAPVPQLQPPRLLDGLVARKVRAGDSVEMSVRVAAVPPADGAPPSPLDVQWLRDGQPIKPDARMHVEIVRADGADTYRLVIQSAQPSDAGRITARVSNPAGSVTSDAPLEVEVFRPPTFTQPLRDVRIREEESTTLTVSAIGAPLPEIQWLRDGETIVSTAERVVITTERFEQTTTTTSTLTVNDALISDAGQITCRAVNAAGHAETRAIFGVEARDEPPRVVQELRSVRVSETESATFSATITGQPTPTAEWLREGHTVDLEGGRFVATSSELQYSLTVKDTQLFDAGEITCHAQNRAGDASSTARLIVDEGVEAPRFLDGLRPITIREGENAAFGVRVAGRPAPTLHWLCDGRPLAVDGVHIILREDAPLQYSLIFKEARLTDAGELSCQAVNKAGAAATSAHFGVEELVEPPRFTEELKPLEIKENGEGVLQATVVGRPAPTVQWLKDGQPIQIDGVHFSAQSDESGRHVITVRNANLSDAGVYRVKAINKAGEAETRANFGVLEDIEAPRFVEGLEPLNVVEHRSGSLTVVVTGRPTPDVQWLRDGQPIQIDGSHVSVRRDGDGKHTLIVADAQFADAAVYSCRAVNKAGQAESSAKFAVLEDVEAPRFVQGLQPLKVLEHQTAQLSVTVTGKPEPRVEWCLNGIPIEIDAAGSRFSVGRTPEGAHTLTVDDCTPNEAGIYSCKAINKAGRDETTANFAVVEDLAEPQFIEPLKDVDVREGAQAALQCTVVGKPAPEVRWLCDGQPIHVDGSHIISKSEGDGRHTLLINNARISDAGTYSCQATNKAGSAQTAADLNFPRVAREDVPVEQTKPIFVEPLQPKRVREGEQVDLKCKVNAPQSQPEIRWFRNDLPIDLSSETNLKAEQSADGTLTLKISSATAKEIGVYKCEAVNLAGKADTVANLSYAEQVQEFVTEEQIKPIFIEPLEPKTVREGEQVDLKCKVNQREAQPEIRWYRNEHPIDLAQETNLQTVQSADGTLTLKISSATAKEMGVYKCEAVNTAGKAETVANLNYAQQVQEVVPEEQIQPIFIEPLEPKTVREGEQVDLKCKVNQREAQPEIRWYRDNVAIDLEQEPNLKAEVTEDGTITLKIQSAGAREVGVYKCEAVNRAGRAETSARLNYAQEVTVEPTEEGALLAFRRELIDERVDLDTVGVLLECQLEPACLHSAIRVDWFKDGVHLTTAKLEMLDAKIELADVQQNGIQRLRVERAKFDHFGVYRCEATDQRDGGAVWTECQLQVLGPAESGQKHGPPEFVELLKSATTTVDGTAVLRCKVRGWPRPTIAWSKEGVPIQESAHIKTDYHEDGTIVLTLRDAKMTDAGEYRCEAENEYGSAWTEGPIVVAAEGTLPVDGEAPDFLEPVRPVTVLEGETAVLEGKITGTPSPDVKWYKGEELLKPDALPDAYRIERFPDGTQRLTVSNAKMSDMDDYRCEASNKYGDVWSDVTLTVQVPLTTEGDGDFGLAAPTFVKTLQEVKVGEGKPAEFECVVVGEPKPEVKWFKDSQEIKADDTHFRPSLGPDGTARLSVASAEKADAGVFRCEAVNPAGRASSEAPLIVTGFRLKRGLEDQTLPRGARLQLSVEVEGGKPRVVRWYRNNEELRSDEHVQLTQLTDESYRLEVANGELSDSGAYRVVLATDSESVESSCRVVVQEGRPTFRKGLSDQTLPKGVPLVLEVEVDGQPKQVKWLKDGKPVDLGRAKAEDLGNGKFRLTIPDPTGDEDFGRYSVVVSNDAGEAESAAQISQAAGKPEIVQGLRPAAVTVGEPVVFEAVTAGGPVKQVKWYKNGKEIENPQTEQTDDRHFRLVIPHAALDDDGAEFKIVLSNDAGSADSAAGLTVKSGVPAIGFVKGLEDQSVPKTATAQLDVETNRPPKTIRWYKNGKEIVPGAGAEKAVPQKLSDTKFRLEIPDANADDTADYTVKVEDEDGNTADSFGHLTVKLPAPLAIVRGLTDQFVPIGKPIELEILTSGAPTQVKWYKNGTELAPSDRLRLDCVNADQFKLVVPASQLDDSASYTVKIANNEGASAESTGKVVVDPVPEFLRPLKDLEVVEGEFVEFSCATSWLEPRNVRWYRNGVELRADNRVEVEQKRVQENGRDATELKLVLKWATSSDIGEYRVVLENTAGRAESNAQLKVRSAVVEPPRIVKGLIDQIVAEGDELVFEVKIQGDVKEVKWRKDDRPADKMANAKIEKIDDETYRLTIPRAELSDAGTFEVQAINDGGKAVSEARAEVDQAPKIVKALVPGQVAVDDDHLFRVEVSTPVRQVKWYKNGEEVKPGAHFKLIEVSPKKYELEVNKAQLDDGATYKVVLSNKAGECDSSAELTVIKPNVVKLLKGLEDVTVDEGQPLALSCRVEGTPNGVQWYKNGKEILPGDARVQLKSNPDTGEYTLIVPEALPSDGAAYRVVFLTDRGDVPSGALATIRAKKVEPKSTPANFLTPLEDVTLPEGDTLTLKCQVGGEPQPTVKWYRNGIELTPDDRLATRLALDGTATLRLRDTCKSDAGEFSVRAINPAAEAESRCKVAVLSADELPSAPKFIVPLKRTEGVPGQDAVFTVKVRGVPKPDITWFLNGKPIAKGDPRLLLEDLGDGNHSLTIRDVQEADFGTIRCVATNENGKDECEANFEPSAEWLARKKDEEGYPPRFNVPLWDRRVPIGLPASIECHVDAKPTAEILWTKDGVELRASDELEIRNTPDGACFLRIPRFEEHHVGEYKCQAKNPYGVADTRSNVGLETPLELEDTGAKQQAPKFSPGLTDATLNASEPLTLNCRVIASPPADVTWYKDGVPLKTNDRLRIDYDPESGECTLKIADGVSDSDAGAYRCVAVNPAGSTNTAANVNVRSAKEATKKEGAEPFFTKGLIDQWLERGDTLVFECAVTGDPQPEIRWYRNGALLKPIPGKLEIENKPNGECRLVVKDVALSDEGVYRCEAENPHGSARTQATAHVDTNLKVEKKELKLGEAPRFIVPLEDATVQLGAAINLECKVTGDPMPTLKWTKDGDSLREDSRFEWETDPATGDYKLRIRDAGPYDEGTYRCVATNASGSATTKSYLRIDDGSAARTAAGTPPRLAVQLADVRVTEGQPLRLECKVDGDPLPELVWYKDGEKVVPSDRLQLECDPDGTARLIIPSCTLDDDGVYRVIATNPHGTAYDKCNATVKKLPKVAEAFKPADEFDANKAPRVVVPLESVRVPEKEPFTLRCKFAGEPKLTIKWFRNGERVYEYGNCRLSETEEPDGSGLTCQLVVDAATRADEGAYRCVAENPYGTARTIGDVTVQLKDRKPRNIADQLNDGKAPGFTIPLTMKKANKGETVVFECLPYGNPFPSIKWLKDGIELLPGDGIRIEASPDGTQRLILDNVDFLSEGFFRCVANNPHGTASTKAELRVLGDRHPAAEVTSNEPEESKPRIRPGLFDQSIHEGSSVEMQIAAYGWPTPTVKWLKDGQPIESGAADGRLTIWTDERGAHHLIILHVEPSDAGEYSVVATNALGEARSAGALAVIQPRQRTDGDHQGRHGMPFPPGFIRQLKNKHIFTHMPTIFDCLVVGYPPPEVEWFHNGKKITPGGRIKIQSCAGGSHALLITDTCPEDAGTYVAIARNDHGSASSSAILDVTTPFLDNIKFDGSMDVTPYLTPEFGFTKINFKSLPTPPDRGPFIKEVTGHHLTLSWIPTKRSPPRYPQVTYVIEIRELPYKDWTLLEYNVPEPVCKVRNLELGKSYQFRVRAENIYGISDPSPPSPPSRLMAPPRPVLDKYKRVIPLLDPYAEKALDEMYGEQYACAPWFAPGCVEKRYCAESDTLTITLHFTGYPDPKIQWKFRGWDVDTTTPNSNIRISTFAGTETTITILGFTKNNAGQYQCVATNQYGDAQQNICIDLATRPKFLQPLTDKLASSEKQLKLDVRVEGSPFPEIKWLKDWRPLAESTRYKFVQDGPYLCSLVVTDPLWRDSGIYSCMALNDAGQAVTSCTVTVEAEGDYNDVQLPKRKVGLEAKKIREIYEIEPDEEK